MTQEILIAVVRTVHEATRLLQRRVADIQRQIMAHKQARAKTAFKLISPKKARQQREVLQANIRKNADILDGLEKLLLATLKDQDLLPSQCNTLSCVEGIKDDALSHETNKAISSLHRLNTRIKKLRSKLHPSEADKKEKADVVEMTELPSYTPILNRRKP